MGGRSPVTGPMLYGTRARVHLAVSAVQMSDVPEISRLDYVTTTGATHEAGFHHGGEPLAEKLVFRPIGAKTLLFFRRAQSRPSLTNRASSSSWRSCAARCARFAASILARLCVGCGAVLEQARLFNAFQLAAGSKRFFRAGFHAPHRRCALDDAVGKTK